MDKTDPEVQSAVAAEKAENTGSEQAAGAERETGSTTEPAGAELDLAMELEQARTEARDNYERMLRMAAEFDNYKKRMAREQENALKFAEENLLKEILPFLDNLERAMSQGRKSDSAEVILEGVELTLNGLLASLEKKGLKPVDGVGVPFNPNFHEALAMEASTEVPAQSVIREFEKGYLFKDKLIRAAKVVVSSGAASAGE